MRQIFTHCTMSSIVIRIVNVNMQPKIREAANVIYVNIQPKIHEAVDVI